MADQADAVKFTTTDQMIKAYVDGIVAELEKLGLQVAVRLPALKVRNPAVVGTDIRGAMMSPGMTQDIMILDRDGRGLGWYWVWPGMRPGERDAPEPQPELVFMCAADEIKFAASRIGKVVRVRLEEDLTCGALPVEGG